MLNGIFEEKDLVCEQDLHGMYPATNTFNDTSLDVAAGGVQNITVQNMIKQ